MTKLLQKEAKFIWISDCEAAFQQLKTLLTTAPVLTQPDITKSFDVYCDASGTGLGCVLMQEGKCHTRFQKGTRMRTTRVPGSVRTHAGDNSIVSSSKC